MVAFLLLFVEVICFPLYFHIHNKICNLDERNLLFQLWLVQWQSNCILLCKCIKIEE